MEYFLLSALAIMLVIVGPILVIWVLSLVYWAVMASGVFKSSDKVNKQ